MGQLTVDISGKFLAMYSRKFYAFLPLPWTSTTWEGLTLLMNSVVWAQSACAAKLISSTDKLTVIGLFVYMLGMQSPFFKLLAMLPSAQ